MKVDAHHHLWHYSPQEYGWIDHRMEVIQRDFLPANLEETCLQAMIDATVVVQARQSEAETEFLLLCAETSPLIRGVVGWTDLCSPHLVQRLDHYHAFPFLKGFRHIVQDEPDEQFILQPDFIRGVQQLVEHDYAYDILIYERQIMAVVRFLEHFEESARLVLDHLGKPEISSAGPTKRWKEGIRLIASHPATSCKLSGLVTEADWEHWTPKDFRLYLDWVWEQFGPDRLLLGSDWPVCLLAAPGYGEVLQLIEDFLSQFPEIEQQKVQGTNAVRFYRLL